MRRQRAPQDAAGVSLFSFLAVLLCTMGALIVLLVVIARQVRAHAQQQTHAATTAVTEDDDQQQLQMWQAALARSRDLRDQAAARLAEGRLELSHLEDHARRLAARLRDLKQSADDLRRAASADQKERARQEDEWKMLEAHVAAVQQELAELGKTQARRANSYAVIPYQGPNQTRRRPVYLECRPEGIIFQPEGIMVSKHDFSHPIGPGNPLAAALRSAREHFSRGRFDGGEPYPLLLVRPDGIGSYYLARRALASWGAEFGYEFVDADWELEFADPDPALAEAERTAIAAARLRQKILAQLPSRGTLRSDRPVYRASREKGGAVLDSGSSPAGGYDRQRSARSGGRGRANGNGGADDDVTADTRPFGKSGADEVGTAKGNPQSASRPVGGHASSDANLPGGDVSEGAVPDDYPLPANRQDLPSAARGGGSSLAGARGKDWGLLGAAPGSVGIGRAIHVVCDADQITILSADPAAMPNKVITLGERTEDSVDELVSDVWGHVKHWGLAGAGMHWRPELVVEVTPSGAKRFDDLQALLRRSGLIVTRGRPTATNTQQTQTSEGPARR